ncbi:MAG: hypothetical protein COZ75_10600 [Flavobacteriaceae bacterium CG_4_8_14_3_um_filter_34_10]|nr:hypothetical protein [Flavobacteriia bacterium]OIP50929.1 MAG: hypothetical protein AUK33_06045 [Flavobacteriaceae bacterium CG2_30_34_30]PIQ18140.1 MAG: hypothetical protein COW66_07975 [Flavobacteriaceae bacterium CG18_big_fil_WC_8_21_14_2_50_34_36]PIV48941.1 MAG: hypothetical protein COS19_11245 [Flavobacteriaceae bacterium CG02_land_8_20_14_3_00_34_13]PIX08703.1 MAG: hypothetical protein COZ75_10600 [Flavobacteriaceae bacterium CG_4_8_14_3_um_filter_34_10]PIZ08301.1 MAG: hypothetical pr
MKTLHPFFLVLAFVFSNAIFAQEQYTVSGKTYALQTEVEGTLTLLWNVIDDEYRYFAKKGNELVELKNTRTDGKYQEEYKEILVSLTSDQSVSSEKTKLTLVSLRSFFNDYNKKVDPNYQENATSVALETRLGIFSGLSNNVSTFNPENVFALLLGIEIEVTDSQMLKHHAAIVQFRHSFKATDYDLTYSQFSINYRYKFIHKESLSLFIQTKLIALTFFERAKDNQEGLLDTTGSSLQTPIGMGLGLDYKLGKGFITFAINDIVSPGVDTNDEFPLDFTLGYKFNL